MRLCLFAVLAAVFALLLLVTPAKVHASADYGTVLIPDDAPPAALAAWRACSTEHQDAAQDALRIEYGSGMVHRTFITEGGDHAEIECLTDLLATLGGRVVAIEPHRDHAGQVTTGYHRRGGMWIQHSPGGWWVTWLDRKDDCRVTVWGVLGPIKPSAPWYSARAPAWAEPCRS